MANCPNQPVLAVAMPMKDLEKFLAEKA